MIRPGFRLVTPPAPIHGNMRRVESVRNGVARVIMPRLTLLCVTTFDKMFELRSEMKCAAYSASESITTCEQWPT